MPGSDRNDAEQSARMKDYNRESRLSFRNFAEHQLRRDLKEEAMGICKPQIEAFATCAKEKGLMVIFSCSDLHKQVKQCLAIHNGDEAWQRYKEQHKNRLERVSRANP